MQQQLSLSHYIATAHHLQPRPVSAPPAHGPSHPAPEDHPARRQRQPQHPHRHHYPHYGPAAGQQSQASGAGPYYCVAQASWAPPAVLLRVSDAGPGCSGDASTTPCHAQQRERRAGGSAAAVAADVAAEDIELLAGLKDLASCQLPLAGSGGSLHEAAEDANKGPQPSGGGGSKRPGHRRQSSRGSHSSQLAPEQLQQLQKSQPAAARPPAQGPNGGEAQKAAAAAEPDEARQAAVVGHKRSRRECSAEPGW